MPDQKPSEVLGGLPRSRPHRRSEKRAPLAAVPPLPEPAPVKPAKPAAVKPAAVKPAGAKPATARKPKPASAKMPRATPAAPRAANAPRKAPSRVAAQKAAKPAPDGRVDILGTAVQAAAELAEIGISAGARALRGAVSRLPRP